MVKKQFGQNFIKSSRYINELIASLNISNTDTIIEIGPGEGSITAKLLETDAKAVISIEIDYDLIPNLLKRFEGKNRFELVNEDFTKINLNEVFNRYQVKGVVKFTGNLPYNLSKKIINIISEYKSLDPEIRLGEMSFIVQDEVAKDYAAKAPKATILSTLMGLNYEIKKLESIPRTQFSPTPKVDGGIIVFSAKYLKIKNNKEIKQFIKIGYSSPRKKVLKNLQSFNEIDKENLQKIFKELGIYENVRPAELSIEQWEKIYEKVIKAKS